MKKCFLKWNEKIFLNKPCYMEQTIERNKLEADIKQYKEKSLTEKGAVLFTYFGGKFCEGYNFKDEHSRGIIMIGTPNINTNEATYHMKK